MENIHKYIIMKNFAGMMKMGGMTAEQALEMALDFEEPLFSARLKSKSPGGGAQTGQGRGGNYSGSGGDSGVITG